MWLLLILASVLWISPAFGQAWSGIINPSRAINWATNQAGVIGGIPTNRTQCGSTIAAYGSAGTPLSAGTINTAITNCGANQFVLLGAGTFHLNSTINITKNNVTLRGSGPDQTIVKFYGNGFGCVFGQVMVCVTGNPTTPWFGTSDTRAWETNWTAGYAKGTTQITVGSTANTAAGRFIFLDQHEELTDNGGIINSRLPNVFGGDNAAPNVGRLDSDDGGNWRVQSHMHKVVSVDSSTTLTIDPPVQMNNWRTGQDPEMFGIGTSSTDVVQGVGMESVTFENVSATHDTLNSIVEFASAYNSWAKNVRTINGPRAHYNTHQGAHIEIRDCYMYKSMESGSQSYGIETQGGYDNLYINNIAHYTAQGFLGPCPGCVLAYNYGFGMYFTLGCADANVGGTGYSSCNWGVAWTHAAGGGMTLWEGNDFGSGIRLDINHGTDPLITHFRNRYGGADDNGVTSQYRMAADIQSFNRAHNFIGNVLGVSGVHTTYEGVVTGPSDPDLDQRIYTMGGNTFGIATDSVVSTSLMRWGNYDTVNAANRFECSEAQPGAIAHVNATTCPASQTLPSSFFLSAQPNWWATPFGTPAWPPIGPTVTGGTISGYGGRVHKIPARLCFENMVNDPAYLSSLPRIKTFNAAACYGSGGGDTTPPAAPTGVTVSKLVD